MLKTIQKTTIDGESIINGVNVAGFRAEINSDNPADMQIAVWQNDKDAYKANREQARADQAEFEDMAYAFQETLIAAKAE